MEYYKLLGIHQKASALEIKNAYRLMARLYHPDFNPGKNTAILFIRIKKAYDTLIDPGKRRNYDDKIALYYSSGSYEQEQSAQNAGSAPDEVIFKRRPTPKDAFKITSCPLLTFMLSDEEYAFDVKDVAGISSYANIVPLNWPSDHLAGTFTVRGDIVPVINLAKNFGFAEDGGSGTKAIILVQIEAMKTGLIVDSMPQMLEIPADKIFDLPDIPPGKPLHFLKLARIDDRLIVILELAQIISKQTVADLKNYYQKMNQSSCS